MFERKNLALEFPCPFKLLYLCHSFHFLLKQLQKPRLLALKKQADVSNSFCVVRFADFSRADAGTQPNLPVETRFFYSIVLENISIRRA